ncbi:peroxisomal ATPase PEX1-like [Liolophura sinensis]|uniref:peroxisomal ATPase PEX1-like n=1 Tax=Liolophura sinensis TaxID=3198878 RepID=UPI003158623D
MTCYCAVLEYKSDKNCFLTLPDGLISGSVSDQITVFELQVEGKGSAYCSWSGETTQASSDGSKTVLLNGLYANKLGIDHGSVVVLKQISGLLECKQVFVEPVSVDDWEILELHASFVETHLLDQVRVVWQGQVLPVWVSSSTCVFLKIGAIQPAGQCVLLVNNTEVIVDPKVRHTSQGQGLAPPPETSSASGDQTSQMDQSNLRRLSSNQKHHSSEPAGMLQGLSDYVKSFFWTPEIVKDMSKPTVNSRKDNSAILEKTFRCGLRVQALRLGEEEAELEYSTNVFVRYSDVAPKNYGNDYSTANPLPSVFFAKITKILSPVEKEEEKKAAEQREAEKAKETNAGNKKPPSNATSNLTKATTTKDLCVVVRVVTIESSGLCMNSSYQAVVRDILRQQTILEGHMMISDFLRRQLKLDVTGRVQLEAVCSPPAEIDTVHLFQISYLPSSINSEMVTAAFRSWLQRALTDKPSLLIFQQMLIRFPVLPDLHLEALLTFDTRKTSASLSADYAVIDLDMCKNLTIVVRERVNGRRKWPEISHRPCSSVTEFDPAVPNVSLENLGGISYLIPKALSHIEMCFGQRPLTQIVYPSMIGLNMGVLLITGARGTGKSTLAKALCRKVAGLPCLAYTSVLECKGLKGKRPETIQRLLEKLFDELSWRQPSIVVLDDVDVLAGSNSGPDEMSAEAQYSYKMSEVIRTLIKCELINNPQLAVIFTTRSRTSVHLSLVASRGLHIIQEVLEIQPQGKRERKEILEAILRSKPSIDPECLPELLHQDLPNRMEGFVAQDLKTVVNRAIHAHHMSNPSGSAQDIWLTGEDFGAALEGYTPVSLRNVTLHQETDVGWADIGGLGEVKKTLVETLEWPTKYPQLFANCPLRLRSGLLLFGAPGTGKTLLARAVAKECGLNFISIKGPELLSKYIGASEEALRDTFARAHSARPCILFFDEFDSIAPRRGHDSTGVTDRVVNQLLTQLDGVERLEGVYVLGATSRPDLIDPALLRPGRLDKCLHCEMPSVEERLEILTSLSRKLKLGDDVDLKTIAENCENFTGADFKALLYNAQLEAIHEMTPVFRKSISNSTSEDLEERTQVVCQSVTTAEKSSSDSRNTTPPEDNDSKLARPESFVTYIPRLEEGPVQLDPEAEKQFLQQVGQLSQRLKTLNLYRSTTGSVSDASPTQNGQSNALIQVSQSHLQKAAKEMRPSVSAEERLKYKMIVGLGISMYSVAITASVYVGVLGTADNTEMTGQSKSLSLYQTLAGCGIVKHNPQDTNRCLREG